MNTKKIAVTFILLTGVAQSVFADASATDVTALNNQIQAQLKQIETQNNQQITAMNTQIQAQIKQMQSDLQAQVGKLSTQTQTQLQQIQKSLQQQIAAVQSDVDKLKKS